MTHAGYFEGIGGFSLAARWLGIETVYTCEIDDFRHNWLKQEFSNATHEKDIKETVGQAADIFTGGFPCQDISEANPAGKGIEGERSGLWHELYRITARHRPDIYCSKTAPDLFTGAYAPYLGNLPQSGMMRNGMCSQSESLDFRTFAKDSSWLPTPCKSDWIVLRFSHAALIRRVKKCLSKKSQFSVRFPEYVVWKYGMYPSPNLFRAIQGFPPNWLLTK